MNSNERNSLSKFLSLVLRHKPREIDLILCDEGWASVKELLEKLNANNKNISFEDLKYIVELNDKKRFIFSDNFSRIRANQGHSLNIDLKLKPVIPPAILYHGTAHKNITSIMEKGILKQERNFVHLSADIETANKVGVRHGKPAIFEVSALEMYKNHFKFYLSENNIWLTDFVDKNYLSFNF
ncbi:RNA 2'-phosphotransferase [Flavobacterium sp. 3HN19-14]|uniref:RNA 2'-phosphotransferase n=1 Tax=Flavobacterium sp. 3HN19-14 TaxID=3448133 RepID=UPI003EE123F8